jgi:hypothetical protein
VNGAAAERRLRLLVGEANKWKFINAIMTSNCSDIYDIHNYVAQFPARSLEATISGDRRRIRAKSCPENLPFEMENHKFLFVARVSLRWSEKDQLTPPR